MFLFTEVKPQNEYLKHNEYECGFAFSGETNAELSLIITITSLIYVLIMFTDDTHLKKKKQRILCHLDIL